MVNPKFVEILKSAIEIEDSPHDDYWLGWTWHEVKASPNTINQMVIEGLVDMTFSSRTQKCYKLADEAKAVEYISAANEPEVIQHEEPLIIPKDLFDFIIGHESTKNILNLSLNADRPVHVALIGAPATAKSLFLEALSRLPGAVYALGGNSSRAGITDYLLDVRPRFLCMDEIDKMSQYDIDVLLTVMESGIVTRMKRGMREKIHLDLWVFAGANDGKRITAPLRSRFIVQELPTYTDTDFREVGLSILTKRERMEPVLASKVVDALSGRTRDPRKVTQVARLVSAGGDLDEIMRSIVI